MMLVSKPVATGHLVIVRVVVLQISFLGSFEDITPIEAIVVNLPYGHFIGIFMREYGLTEH